MMYFPSRQSLSDLENRQKALPMQLWFAPSGEYLGWKSGGTSNGLRALVVHGNGGCAADRAHYAQGLTQAGMGEVYILEYPGYGARSGSPNQESLCAAASEALTLLAKDKPIYVVGESLGTGVASFLAGTYPDKVAGALLMAPYNSMVDVAQSHMTLLPVWLMLKDRYPASTWLQPYHGPVAVVLAGADTVVPNRFGRRLYEGYSGPKKVWLIPGAEHGDAFERPLVWWDELAQFWKTLPTK
jgi:pimeloyl-ACP methyl ester carboxylesterase